MKHYSLSIIFVLLISCNCSKDEKALKRHYPTTDISQSIYDERARNLYDDGCNYSLMGDYINAKNSFDKSFEIEESPLTLNELGWIEFAQKNHEKAIEYYVRGRTMDSLYWPIYINEAKSLEKMSAFDEAEKTLLKLKELCDSDYWIAYADLYLAIVYYNSGQECEKVYEYLEKSKRISTDPDLTEQYLLLKKHIKKNVAKSITLPSQRALCPCFADFACKKKSRINA